jgi:mannose-1-phosphate guanylyltransferase
MSPLPPALVLAAGLGTRLLPLTSVRAKPALPVAGVPLICRLVGWLGREGVLEAIVNLHHLPESITGVLGDGFDLGVRVRYSWEQPQVLGSAGGPRQALDIIGHETFFLVNGDTIADVALADLASDHARHNALVTMSLVPNAEPQKYGGVMLDAAGAVTGFVRRGDGAIGSYHFVGVQVAQREVFASIAAGEPVNSVGGRYDALIREQPGALRGFVTSVAFCDIGTVSDYWRTSRALAPSGPGVVAASVQIAPDARVADSIVWDDVQVGAGAVVERCIVTDGVIVPAGTHFRGSILMNGDGNRITVVSLPEDCQ